MGKIPSTWLDDPEWEMLRRKAERRPVPKQLRREVATQKQTIRSRQDNVPPRAQAGKQVTEKEVVLNLKLRMPRFTLPDLRHLLRRFFTKLWGGKTRKPALVLGACILALLVFGMASVFFSDGGGAGGKASDQPKSAEEQAKADFNPLVPLQGLTDASGKKTEAQFRYDQEKKVLGYVTDYNGAHLTISQQQAPGDLGSDPAKLLSVAGTVDANAPLETQKGTAYIATDEKAGTQLALFATDEVLVFIRSDKTLDDDEWKFYINQLNPAE